MTIFKFKTPFILALTFLFTGIFFEKLIGLNLFVFEIILLVLSIIIHKPQFKSSLSKVILIGTLISLLMVVLHNSRLAMVFNMVSFFALLGSITCSDFKLFHNYFSQSFNNIKLGIISFFGALFSKKGNKLNMINYLKIILIPMLIITVFLLIYYNSNKYFAELVDSFFETFTTTLNWLPSLDINFLAVFILILLLVASVFNLTVSSKTIVSETGLTKNLIRKKKINNLGKIMALKNEYKSAFFLLLVLNVMLLIFNYSDITSVWFSYQWDGSFLKDFVHTGTYLLIISLIMSIWIVLYYFRGNLNFYSKIKPLKILTYIWLGQNLILVVSLFIRNLIYIENFALAYKRIGVYAFLIATCIGIYTIILKVKRKKSFYYLLKINTLSIYLILLIMTCINWDVLIAKYNISASNKSFVELEFLLDLSDKALPYIDLDIIQLEKMEIKQTSLFSFKHHYISNENYLDFLNEKKLNFLNQYPRRSVWEWNYADYSTYKKLNMR